MVQKLSELLQAYPDSMQDKKRFKALLYDYLPMKRKEANAIYMALEIGIPNNMLEVSAVTMADIVRYERQLKSNYGLDDRLIFQVIKTWAQTLNVKMDNDYLQKKEEDEIQDFQIVRKYRDMDDIWEMVTAAAKDKFEFVRKNYASTKKQFDDIIKDLFKCEMEEAIELWLWVLRTYWKVEKDDERASEIFISSIFQSIGRDQMTDFVAALEKYPDIIEFIFGYITEIDHPHNMVLQEMLLQDKLDLFKRAWSFLSQNRKRKSLSTDEILEELVRCIRTSRSRMMSNSAVALLEDEVSKMKSKVIKNNTKKVLEEKKKSIEYFSQNVSEASKRSTVWDFAALKEQAVAQRKKSPLWKGHKFISFTTVVGLYYIADKDEIILDMKKGDALTIVREPENEYDSMAVAVYDKKHRKMGYLPKESNTFMSTMMDAGKEFIARLFAFEKGRGSANIAIEIFIKE